MPEIAEASELVSSVQFSDEERRSGAPSSDKLSQAVDLFQKHGFVRLDNIFDREMMRQLDEHYRRRYAQFLSETSQPDQRPLFTVEVEGPFNDSRLYANPVAFPFLQANLGDDCILGAMSSVVSFPGAPDQHIHRDSQAIFGDDYRIDKDIPPYAMTMLVPLIDCTTETGCTKVWPGSHLCATQDEAMQIESIDPEVSVGSVLITNSKVVHCGGANVSDRLRPIVYLSYHRSWFRDFWGYENRPPVEISNREFNKVAAEHQHLFAWTRDPYRRIRRRRAVGRFVPTSLKQLLRKLRG